MTEDDNLEFTERGEDVEVRTGIFSGMSATGVRQVPRLGNHRKIAADVLRP
jgi:hypothetical protein